MYDVIVIGGGPGGYVAAIRAAQLGLKTAVVEQEELGGVCLNWGCIPSKALLRNAEIVSVIRHQSDLLGLSFKEFSADYGQAHKRSREVSAKLVGGVGFLMKKNKIDVHRGRGRITGPGKVSVDGKDVLETRNIIIATGARARSIPGVDVDGKSVITSREALDLQQAPGSICIVGGGAIGCEFAYLLNAYGTEVHQVELLPRLVPLEDEESSAALEKSFKAQGINVYTGVSTKSVKQSGKSVSVTLSDDRELKVDMVLVAVGVQPNTEDIGLDTVGVATEKGFITVDNVGRTNAAGVYAIGDCNGGLLLAHVAMHEGVVAAEVIAGHDPVPIEDVNMPRATYCRPQVASWGLTEAQARDRHPEVKVGKFPFSANGKALGMAEPEGFAKMVVDGKTGQILGAHIVGGEGTEVLLAAGVGGGFEASAGEFATIVAAHPTMSEALHEAALAASTGALHI
ncbi:MAG: dihydrolipoyl dehydrogenase [Candidatus Dormibacteria bacterium]